MEEFTVKKYKTNGGYIFTSKEQAEINEQVENSCKEISEFLIDKEQFDKGCSFSNGHGYIQYDPIIVEQMKEKFHQIATKAINNDSVRYINSDEWLKWHNISEKEKAIKEAEEKKYDRYFIGRYLDDGSYRFLYSLWGRLSNINSLGREFGQGYYTLHPEEADLIQLNK